MGVGVWKGGWGGVSQEAQVAMATGKWDEGKTRTKGGEATNSRKSGKKDEGRRD